MNSRWLVSLRSNRSAQHVLGRETARSRKASRRAVLEFLEDRTLLSTTIPLNSISWSPIGPTGITGTSTFGGGNGGPVSGRITGIASDPLNANVTYIATASGGVWKTANGGTSWTPLTDNLTDGLGNPIPLFMGSIAVASSNANVIYAGTGEANNSLDSYAGRGVLKSTDAGATWTLVGATQFTGKSIGAIAVSPLDPNVVYVAVSASGANGTPGGTGIWESTDGGTTWTNTTSAITTTQSWTDVVIDQTNPQNVYASVGTYSGNAANGVYKSTNGGTSWAAAGNFPIGVANGRIAMAISASNPQVLVASVSDPSTYGLKYLEKSSDGGVTWAALTGTPDYLGGANTGGGQGWYDNTVIINPTNPNVIIAAGVVNYNNGTNAIVYSRNGGTNWTDITADFFGNQPHTDSHALAFDANGRALVGTDGGIWRLDAVPPAAIQWTNLNANIATIQFTGTALNPQNANIVYGGSQDNGTEKFNDNAVWSQVLGGDGGYTAVDPVNPQIVYAEYDGATFERSTNGGATWTDLSTGLSGNGNFYSAFTLDPNNRQHILYGTDRIFTTSNSGTTWSQLTTPGSNGWNSTSGINWIAVAPTDSKTIYAATADAKVFVSTDGGTNWTERDIPTATDAVSKLLVDPSSSQTVYAVRGAYDGAGTGHVFKSTNGGVNWTDISGNLPDIPTWSIALDPRVGYNRIYVGTDVGVYMSSDGGTNWAPFRTGLPNAQVVTLELNPTLNVILAGTHGRGAFEILASESIQVVPSTITAVESVGFTNQEVAQFRDSSGNKATNLYTATIDWGDGTPTTLGLISDLGTGYYGVTGSHLYSEEGSFTVTVSIVGPASITGQSASPVTVSDASLTPSPTTIVTTEGATFSGTVGQFTDLNASAPLSDFTATIDWGDGTSPTSGTIEIAGGGTFNVLGSHVYADDSTVHGPYTITITVNDIGGASTQILSTANVADASLTPLPATVNYVVGNAVSKVVGSFTDANASAPISDFAVVISWGDGSPNTTLANGAIVQLGTNQFDVFAPHTYQTVGTYTLDITINDIGGSFTVIHSTAVVADASLSTTSTSITLNEGGTFSGRFGTLTSSDPFAVVGDYATPIINWGDGTTSNATLTALGNGVFAVSGTHVFGEEGSYTVNVPIISLGGATTTLTTQATILDVPIKATGTTINATAGQILGTGSIPGLVATFVDTYAGSNPSEFVATIDWGDGSTPTTGTITQSGGIGTTYSVTGQHQYAQPLTYTITVTIVDSDGTASDTATSTANMADPPITDTTLNVPAQTEGGTFMGAIGTFTSANPIALASDYFVSVAWGDGSSSPTELTPLGNGVFGVTTSLPHTYTEEGTYTVVLSVHSNFGQSATRYVTIMVADGVITASPGNAIQTVAGTQFNGVVGSFTENAAAPLSDFTATIDWGDGSPASTGVVSVGTGGAFDVSASHAFARSGLYTVNITVTDVGGSTATFSVGATVTDPAFQITTSPISAVQGLLYTGILATVAELNPYATQAEFTAAVNWGDGTPLAPAVITGSNGTFHVVGSHVYQNAAAAYNFRVYVVHNVPLGQSGTSSSTAHVLIPLSGQMNRASDTGASNNDGVTSVTRPIFYGKAEPGSSVTVFAHQIGGAVDPITVGTAVADASGYWALQANTMNPGAYVMTASVFDSVSGALVQNTALAVSSKGSVLVITNTGPSVLSTRILAASSQLQVVFQGGLGGFNMAGLLNSSNYVLQGLNANGTLQRYTATNLVAVPGANNTEIVTITYSVPRGRIGSYVVTLHALGLTDLANNILVERNLVTFPQTTNAPNPDYVAQIDVSRGGVSSAPHQYISLAEQRAAYYYALQQQRTKIVRVPQRAAFRFSR